MSKLSLSFRKLKLHLEFYKTILVYSIVFSVFLLTLFDIKSAFFYGGFIGLFTTLFLKETNKNKDYLFYLNCNISKLSLYGFGFLLNMFIVLILLIIFK